MKIQQSNTGDPVSTHRENSTWSRRRILRAAAGTLGTGALFSERSRAQSEDERRLTFVLVHGAWHGGWCWQRVARLLRDRGHDVFTPTLTGLGERSHLLSAEIDLDTHIADVVNVFEWEDLENVTLCGHSYGGFVISGVAERLPSRISSIVYLDAFVPAGGEHLSDDAVEAARRGDVTVPPIPAETFGVNPADRAWVDAKCTPQPIGTFTQPIGLTGAFDRIERKTYVRATAFENERFDRAFERALQDDTWNTLGLPSGHDVMIDLPDRLADVLVSASLSESTA